MEFSPLSVVDTQFYPTPNSLIGKMLARVD